MRKLVTAAIRAVAVVVGPNVSSALSDTAQIQALEASIREGRAMGVDSAYIQQMETMLEAVRADAARAGSGPAPAGPTMEPNYFDVVGGRDYSDCDQYSDTQAYTFCMSAVHGYIVYTEVFAKEGASPAAAQVYDGHSETVRNLINYVDNFMTAPRRY